MWVHGIESATHAIAPNEKKNTALALIEQVNRQNPPVRDHRIEFEKKTYTKQKLDFIVFPEVVCATNCMVIISNAFILFLLFLFLFCFVFVLFFPFIYGTVSSILQ